MPGLDLETTVAVTEIRLLLHACREHGVEEGPVLRLLKLTRTQLEDPDARVPRGNAYALWERLPALTGNAHAGLWLAEHTPTGAMGVIYYVSRHSRTYGEALRTIVRYVRLVHDGALMELADDGPDVVLTHRVAGDPRGCPAPLADWLFGHLVHDGRLLTGTQFACTGLSLQAPRPTDMRPYTRLFGCVPAFGAATNHLRLAHEVLALPLKGSDPALRSLMRRFADEQVGRLPKAEGFEERLNQVLSELLASGAPRLDDVARALGMSARTLQRRLREANTSFQSAVGSVRQALAERYLAERDFSVNEIAFLLGYSEPSAFHRSFKRWRGLTPLEFRQQAG